MSIRTMQHPHFFKHQFEVTSVTDVAERWIYWSIVSLSYVPKQIVPQKMCLWLLTQTSSGGLLAPSWSV